MKITLSGINHAIELMEGEVCTLEIENRTLYANVCRSLASGEGGSAFEPYSVWDDDGEELTPSSSLLVVTDPLNLPWEHKALSGKLFDRLENLLFESEESRDEVESLASSLFRAIARLPHQVNAEYSFGLEWSLRQYLKSFAFHVDRFESSRYLDSLISFLDFSSDMGVKQVLVFSNLKTFLSKTDLIEVFEHVFFHNLRVLLLETAHDGTCYEHEKKMYIDQHFLEF